MGLTDAHLARVLRADRGRLLAALIASLRDFDLAEEALSEAQISALEHWGRSGVPDNPAAWLIRVARRKAIDRLRRAGRWRGVAADLALLAEDEAALSEPPPDIPDERLRLIFTCCHPALDPKSRVALTLRTVCGLTTAEIARGFLDSEATMGQRLSRAKAKIRDAGIPYVVPGLEVFAERLESVLTVIYLIFNEGYSASSGDSQIRCALCDDAMRLARLLDALAPEMAEVEGLLSLMLTTHARRLARSSESGTLVPLDRQNRGLWDRRLIAEGMELLDRAMSRRQPGPFQIKAAISALHGKAESSADTDWVQMTLLYDSLFAYEPTPVVQLNRAAALAESGAPERALAEVAALADVLDHYQPFHATRAALLARLRRGEEAALAYDRALALTATAAERAFLTERRAALP